MKIQNWMKGALLATAIAAIGPVSAIVKNATGTSGGGSGAPTDATYITQTANATLTNEQALAALTSGVVHNTTTTGVLSVSAVDLATEVTGTLLAAQFPAITGDCTTPGASLTLTCLSLTNLTGNINPAAAATSTSTGRTLTVKSGAGGSTSGASGAMTVTTGSVTDGDTGALNLTTAAATGTARNTGSVIVRSGVPTAGGASGSFTLGSGNASGLANSTTGSAQMVSGIATGTNGISGGVTVGSGNASNGSGTSGDLTLQTGSGNTTGNINLVVGAAATTKGQLIIKVNGDNWAHFPDLRGNWLLDPQPAFGSTSNDGFLWIPQGAGTPTGVPHTDADPDYLNSAPIYYDKTNFRLYGYDFGGAAWKNLADFPTAADAKIASANTFTAVQTFSLAEPRLLLSESDQGSDLKLWDFDLNGAVLTGRTRTDADGAGKNWLSITRGTTTAISTVAFGNATDNPAYSFLGSGTTTFAGALTGVTRIDAQRIALSTNATLPGTGIYSPASNRLAFSSNTTYRGEFDAVGQLIIGTVGSGLSVKEGSNAKMGTCTLVVGTCTVSTTAVTANSRIFLTAQSLGTVSVGQGLAISARTAGTSFVVTSGSATDTSVVAWMIVEPSP